MKKWIFIIIGAAVLGVPGWLVWSRIKQSAELSRAAQILPTDKAQLRDIEAAIDTTGLVQPIISTEVRSEISGRINLIKVKNGETVKKDDFLMELDKVALGAALTEAQRQFQAQQLRVDQAGRDFERQKVLKERGFAVGKDYDTAETDLGLSKINLEVLKSRLDDALDKLSKASIQAPQDGIVSDLTVNPGQVIIGATSVNQGTLLMKINDLARMVVEADVNEIDIPKVTANQTAEVSFDSLPNNKFPATIYEVSPSAINRNNLRVFPVKVSFDRGDVNVRPGISANVHVPTAKMEKTLSVVISAVYSSGPERYVYLKKGENAFERRPIETGINDSAHVQVLSGLREGDEVSLTRPKQVINGEVTPAPASGNTTAKPAH